VIQGGTTTADRRDGTGSGDRESVLSMNVSPTRLAPRVLARLGCQPVPLYDGEFLAALATCIRMLREILGAPGATVLVVPGTGTAAMEAVAASLLPPGTTVAVASSGMWGDRWAGICRRLGLRVFVAEAEPGEAPYPGELDRLMASEPVGALLATHVDSSSAVRGDIRTLAVLARRHGAAFLVDGVCAAGAEQVDQSAIGADVYLTTSAKALSGAAGLAIVSLLPGAAALLESRDWACRSYSLDLRPWLPVMRAAEAGEPGYFQTPSISLVLGLAEAVTMIREEGIACRIARHRSLRGMLHEGLDRIGISQLVTEPALRGNGVTVCWYPARGDARFLDLVRARGVSMPTGVHPVAGNRTFRIGHLGNVTKADIERTLDALEAAMRAR
jgi:alanine-glyoxylate transaminase/serine-glyoxylate transaminase/serine-pyruvate transaminase